MEQSPRAQGSLSATSTMSRFVDDDWDRYDFLDEYRYDRYCEDNGLYPYDHDDDKYENYANNIRLNIASRMEALEHDMKKERILQTDREARARAYQLRLEKEEQCRVAAEEAERVRKIAAREKRLAKEERKRSHQAETDTLKAELQEVASRAKEKQ
jgi:hypothetical protein